WAEPMARVPVGDQVDHSRKESADGPVLAERPGPAAAAALPAGAPPGRPPRRFVPRLEALEDRFAPATVTTLLHDVPGSLRQAIALTEPGGTVDFAPGLAGTVTLTAGQLTLDHDLAIAGPGASVITVSGNDAFRVFEVLPGVTAALSGLTIAGGGGVEMGGGILNAGTLTIADVVVSGNAAFSAATAQGGGIYNAGVLAVARSVVRDNAASGGSVGSGGGINNAASATLTVAGSAVIGNTAFGVLRGFGGGVANAG